MDPRTTYEHRRQVQILDVREPEEWAAGHIEGARHVPMKQVPARLDEINRERLVVAVCRSGRRSDEVAKYLSRLGISAENMRGGLEQWTAEGLPIQRPDSRSH